MQQWYGVPNAAEHSKTGRGERSQTKEETERNHAKQGNKWKKRPLLSERLAKCKDKVKRKSPRESYREPGPNQLQKEPGHFN